MNVKQFGFFLAFFLATVTISGAQESVSFSSSNLPIIKINTRGEQISDDPKIFADMAIIDNGPGATNHVTDAANDFNGVIGIEFRGSSSQSFPKKQFGIEIWDEAGNGIDASLLGMPKKDDWVLYAAFDDKSLMRDALAYHLGRAQGRYASRSRYCEVVINNVYQGVYILLEKVKRDKNRVAIAKMDPSYTTGDELTGGYIIKVDKTTGSGGGQGWFSPYPTNHSTEGQRINFLYEYPKPEDIVGEQILYIKDYISQFESALHGANFKDEVNGYIKYIDRASFIDFFLMNEITKNPDGYRLSTYFYKMRDSDGGKLHMGPIWDFNEGFGNVDYCTQGNAEGWAYQFNSACPEDGWQIPFWWDQFLKDDNFRGALKDRWSELRSSTFQESSIQGYIDSVSTVLNVGSQQRNFEAWPILGVYVWPNYYVGPTYVSEVTWLKDWVTKRLAWMDTNIIGITSGIPDGEKEFTATVYPNPVGKELKLDYTINHPGLLSVDVYDIVGRPVDHLEKDHLETGAKQLTMPTQGLAPGTYVVRTRFGSEVVIEKVLVLGVQ